MKIINLTSRSVTIELDTNTNYYTDKYDIYLNNIYYKSSDKNVFSIFDLTPNTSYVVNIGDKELLFSTLDEYVCLNIKKFGAIGDGVSDDTSFIQAAILSTPDNGVCYIPKGTYRVKPLFLKSNMMLYLASGATLIANNNRLEYPILPKCEEVTLGLWEGISDDEFASVLNCINVSNVVITGQGIIDGDALNGDWYINHRVKNIAWRGHLFFSNNAKNITIEGLSFKDSISWTIHPFLSENVNIYNISIDNKPSMPTTDGIDPDMVDGMNIIGCRFNVGDDCIAIKSGSYDLALKYKRPSKNIIIRNNLMEEGHGGVVFGSESSGGILNVTVEKCIFNNTDRGLRIKTRRGRGRVGIIDNITFNNITMNKVLTPFVINMYYNMGNKGGHEEYVWTTKKLLVDEYTPIVGNFLFSNIKCSEVEYAAGVFLGLPEAKIGHLKFENVSFSYNKDAKEGYPVMIEHNFTLKKSGLFSFNVEDITLDNVTFSGLDGDKIIRKEDL